MIVHYKNDFSSKQDDSEIQYKNCMHKVILKNSIVVKVVAPGLLTSWRPSTYVIPHNRHGFETTSGLY